MRYNQRCHLVYYRKEEGFLDDSAVFDHKDLVACNVSDLDTEENVNLFGKYNDKAFKIHIQGKYSGFRYVEIDGNQYTPSRVRYPRNATVVIVT